VIASNHAVRLGLRAASRNPELAFGRALIDQGGLLLTMLPLALAVMLLFGGDLSDLLRRAAVLPWPTLAAICAAIGISFALGMLFWAGALPLLAADVEMDRRPPAGHFLPLSVRGFGRVAAAGFLAEAFAALFSLVFLALPIVALPVAIVKPSMLLFTLLALAGALSVVLAMLLDLLLRLWILRAAAFGEGPSVAFGKAASLLFARLGQFIIIALAFLLLELIVGAVAGGLGGLISGYGFFDPDVQLLSLAPRAALGLAFAAIFSWLEVGRMGALAAIACDAEGLLGPHEPPVAEQVVEALPVD
jgi:hypothetical protein